MGGQQEGTPGVLLLLLCMCVHVCGKALFRRCTFTFVLHMVNKPTWNATYRTFFRGNL
jgi:hypothetical protein